MTVLFHLHLSRFSQGLADAPSVWEIAQPWASPSVAAVAAAVSFLAFLNARRSRRATEASAETARVALKLAQDQFEESKAARQRERYDAQRRSTLEMSDAIFAAFAHIEVTAAKAEHGHSELIDSSETRELLGDAQTKLFYAHPFILETPFGPTLEAVGEALSVAARSVSDYCIGTGDAASIRHASDQLNEAGRDFVELSAPWLNESFDG